MTTLRAMSGTREVSINPDVIQACSHRISVLVALIRFTSLDLIDTLSAPGPLPKAFPS